jgi:transcriptional regulator with XRE-family HTH domain
MSKKEKPPTSRTDFGQRMFDARTAKKLTQVQVRNRLHISQGTVSEAETTGHGSVYVVDFAMLYGVNPVWLARGEGPKTGGLPAPQWWLDLDEENKKAIEKLAIMHLDAQKNPKEGPGHQISKDQKKKKPGTPTGVLVSNGDKTEPWKW